MGYIFKDTPLAILGLISIAIAGLKMYWAWIQKALSYLTWPPNMITFFLYAGILAIIFSLFSGTLIFPRKSGHNEELVTA